MEKWIALEYVEVVFSLLLPSFLAAAHVLTCGARRTMEDEGGKELHMGMMFSMRTSSAGRGLGREGLGGRRSLGMSSKG
jgi:hypothetical protein